MKYTNEIEINLPRERVIELFDNPDNMKHWQKGFISFEHLSGAAGQPGAKSKLRYKMGSRDVEMIETITKRDLPHEFNGTYEASGVYNVVNNRFVDVDGSKTKWIAENEFRFSGFMKLMGWLMPGAFKKQSQKFLDDFKAFAESQR